MRMRPGANRLFARPPEAHARLTHLQIRVCVSPTDLRKCADGGPIGPLMPRKKRSGPIGPLAFAPNPPRISSVLPERLLTGRDDPSHEERAAGAREKLPPQ